MAQTLSPTGAVGAIRQATAHVDSDGLRSSTGARGSAASLRKLDVEQSFDASLADPSSQRGASMTPSSATESENISVQGEDDEKLQRMAAACRTLLECLGEDPEREGLLKTPMRMAKALVACTAGYSQDPSAIVSDAMFACDGDDMVVVRDIACFSMCEHHMLPFAGKVHIGYMPNGKVVGLSKLARLTDCFSKRLQIQERLTRQIAEAVQQCTGAHGVAVMCEATHMCMTMRGVEKPGSMTQSVCFTGAFKDNKDLRLEFTQAVRGAAASSAFGGR